DPMDASDCRIIRSTVPRRKVALPSLFDILMDVLIEFEKKSKFGRMTWTIRIAARYTACGCGGDDQCDHAAADLVGARLLAIMHFQRIPGTKKQGWAEYSR